MPTEGDQKLLDLVDKALDVDPAKRLAWLREACRGDAQLYDEAHKLLSFDEQANDLLQVGEAATDLRRASQLSQIAPSSAATGTLREGEKLGDYQIEKQIGAGGMGVVYRAKQVSLNRQVALKVLPANLRSMPNALARFQQEVEAAGRLHHPHIVSVYATGDDGTTSYYAMELIDGATLGQVIDQLRRNPVLELRETTPSPNKVVENEQPSNESHDNFSLLLSPKNFSQNALASGKHSERTTRSYFDILATRMADVADALDYAHRNEVVHRDIKPSNLLLSKDGLLHVGDFGLARILAEPGVTQTGEFVGTPYYMAPEQIENKSGTIDGRTDIYALGATLYELLTLRPPHPGSSRAQVLNSILHEAPIAPKRINRRVPRDLETICMKALEKNQAHRYQTAAQMAADLRRVAERLPISVKRNSLLVRGWKWCQRHPSVAATLLVALGLGVTAAALAFRAHESGRDRILAEKQRDDAAARASQIEQDLQEAQVAVGPCPTNGTTNCLPKSVIGSDARRSRICQCCNSQSRDIRRLSRAATHSSWSNRNVVRKL